jgi:hypothetical protein
VPSADVASYSTACSTGLSGIPGTTCSPDSLTGCCLFHSGPTASFGSPSATCYYPGDTVDSTSCPTLGGTWSTTVP